MNPVECLYCMNNQIEVGVEWPWRLAMKPYMKSANQGPVKNFYYPTKYWYTKSQEDAESLKKQMSKDLHMALRYPTDWAVEPNPVVTKDL